MSDLALCPRSILEIRPRSLSSLYPWDSTSLSVLALYPCFVLASRTPLVLASNLATAFLLYILVFVLASRTLLALPFWPRTVFDLFLHISSFMSSTQPKADLRCYRSIREAKSMRPRRYVSPRTLALPPSDWHDSWASEGHAFDIKTLVWLETKKD